MENELKKAHPQIAIALKDYMKKILFLIHDLGPGGAEKVLVNLVNHMDRTKFDITVMALFGGGVNEQFLKKDIRLINCHAKSVRGNSHLMKLFSPEQLHRHYIKEHYDIEVAYLEGPCARIVSGCEDSTTKLVAWIHSTINNARTFSTSFRSCTEAKACYRRFQKLVFVSGSVRDAFLKLCKADDSAVVLYNTNESEIILAHSQESTEDVFFENEINLVCVGKLTENKGFHRLIPMVRRLRNDGFPVHLYILGTGPMKEELENLAAENQISSFVTLLGYQTNPYKYVAKCDLFVCASYAEGFSTAATEALIVGTPVCTVDVSGMKEMLGEHNEWGIVTENNEEALYQGIKHLLDDPALLAYYKQKAAERSKTFSTENTVRAVEGMLLSI